MFNGLPIAIFSVSGAYWRQIYHLSQLSPPSLDLAILEESI
jgi:hypothetical protein